MDSSGGCWAFQPVPVTQLRTMLVSRHQKGNPFWILLEQEMMGWQWHQLDHMQIICTTPHFRQITTSVPHHWVFYRPDALPAIQPTASKFWSQKAKLNCTLYYRMLCRHLVVRAKYSIKPKTRWRSIPLLPWRLRAVIGLTTSSTTARWVWWVSVCPTTCFVWCSIVSYSQSDYYLCQGGYVIVIVYLFVCLSVC